MTGRAAGAQPREEWAPRPETPSRHWVLAKWLVLIAYVGVVTSLAVAPNEAVVIFWNVLVPLLPAVFLVNVEVWRNVCPLATLNTIRSGEDGRPMSKGAARTATAVGIGTLLLCLPLRKAVLSGDGLTTACLVGGVGILALLSGLRFQRKAGFCNSICPVLPVERLYGARPMVEVENARCTPCRACTRSGCIDLGTGRAVLQILGDAAKTRSWIRTPYGAFGLTFPGIVAAYYLMPASMESTIAGATIAITLGAVVSWAVLGSIVAVRPIDPTRSLLWSGALAAALYYWFTIAATSDALELPPPAEAGLRALALTLILVWLLRGLGRSRREELVAISVRRG